jgi:hypothetical protein
VKASECIGLAKRSQSSYNASTMVQRSNPRAIIVRVQCNRNAVIVKQAKLFRGNHNCNVIYSCYKGNLETLANCNTKAMQCNAIRYRNDCRVIAIILKSDCKIMAKRIYQDLRTIPKDFRND